MAVAPHPDSVIAGAEREVPLTARRASWGDDPPNSLAALESCLRAPVARVAVDLHVVKSLGFVAGRGLLPPTVHDRPPPAGATSPRRSSPRCPARRPSSCGWSGRPRSAWARTEELARLVAPVAKRIVVTGGPTGTSAGCAPSRPTCGWGSRRRSTWAAIRPPRAPTGRRHPARARRARGAPAPRDVRGDARRGRHRRRPDPPPGDETERGTLDTTTARWRERLTRAVDGGADMIATETPRALARS